MIHKLQRQAHLRHFHTVPNCVWVLLYSFLSSERVSCGDLTCGSGVNGKKSHGSNGFRWSNHFLPSFLSGFTSNAGLSGIRLTTT